MHIVYFQEVPPITNINNIAGFVGHQTVVSRSPELETTFVNMFSKQTSSKPKQKPKKMQVVCQERERRRATERH
ncbi:hypothetical protein Aduo_008687 [Ancylostoma duodenale]